MTQLASKIILSTMSEVEQNTYVLLTTMLNVTIAKNSELPSIMHFNELSLEILLANTDEIHAEFAAVFIYAQLQEPFIDKANKHDDLDFLIKLVQYFTLNKFSEDDDKAIAIELMSLLAQKAKQEATVH